MAQKLGTRQNFQSATFLQPTDCISITPEIIRHRSQPRFSSLYRPRLRLLCRNARRYHSPARALWMGRSPVATVRQIPLLQYVHVRSKSFHHVDAILQVTQHAIVVQILTTEIVYAPQIRNAVDVCARAVVGHSMSLVHVPQIHSLPAVILLHGPLFALIPSLLRSAGARWWRNGAAG